MGGNKTPSQLAGAAVQLLLPLCLLALTAAPVSAHSLSTDLALLDAELDVSALVVSAQTGEVSGSVGFTVVNLGSTPVSIPFEVLAYEERDGNAGYDPDADLFLGATTIAALDSAGTSATVDVAGTLRFRNSPVTIWIDSSDVVSESDEGNNRRSTGDRCEYQPPAGVIEPVIEWSWTASPILPDYTQVCSMPVVADLNADGTPEVIFSAAAVLDSSNPGGVLRILNGSNGQEIATIEQPRVNAAASLCVGDIDQDGFVEILAHSDSGTSAIANLLAFEHDGTLKWESDPIDSLRWGAISLANLDATGPPEIIVGNQVLNSLGNLAYAGTGAAGHNGSSTGPISIVADFDLNGSQNVIAGGSIYEPDMSLTPGWPTTLGEGFTAIANFDLDPQGEIALVRNGDLKVLDHDGTVLTSVAFASNRGGPPTIADFDGDGEAEIGVAGSQRYKVFETDGTLLWESVPINDDSSGKTGSSVFDFNGDGVAEVVYRDQDYLYLFSGPTGEVIYQTVMSSCTWLEYPLVADVDADGNAEILVGTNYFGIGGCVGEQSVPGIYLLGDALDNWVATRPLWNQHSYHITNIEDDGSIPLSEDVSWLYPLSAPYNSYRQNVFTGEGSALSAPDLSASLLSCTTTSTGLLITARAGNGGSVPVGAGVPVSFYGGDPLAGGLLLGTVFTPEALQPGDYADVSLDIPVLPDTEDPLHVRVDDLGLDPSLPTGIANECDESNNVHSYPVSCATGLAYIRGNCNQTDQLVNIADIVWLLQQAFGEGPTSTCLLACDANADGDIDVGDAVYIATYRFLLGPPPPAPFPLCGVTGSTGSLTCESSLCP